MFKSAVLYLQNILERQHLRYRLLHWNHCGWEQPKSASMNDFSHDSNKFSAKPAAFLQSTCQLTFPLINLYWTLQKSSRFFGTETLYTPFSKKGMIVRTSSIIDANFFKITFSISDIKVSINDCLTAEHCSGVFLSKCSFFGPM